MRKLEKRIILGISIALVIVIVAGVSFALWSTIYYQKEVNILEMDCFNIEFTEGEGITLNNAYPMPDSLGMNVTPYTFTITNTCESLASFQINLVPLILQM